MFLATSFRGIQIPSARLVVKRVCVDSDLHASAVADIGIEGEEPFDSMSVEFSYKGGDVFAEAEEAFGGNAKIAACTAKFQGVRVGNE
jgi:hypothetical protein